MYTLFLGHEKKAMGKLLMLLFYSVLSTGSALGAMNSNQIIRDGETLASAGEIFELGFFNPDNVSARYLGIWYKNITPRTVVWVANRKFPLADSSGILSMTGRGVLILLNGRKIVVWSSTHASGAGHDSVVQLLDSGNLVVRERNGSNSGNYIWQSFDYPCDTLLSGMKLGKDFSTGFEIYLSPWQSPKNPAPGPIFLGIDPHGYPQVVLKLASITVFRPGSWNGITFLATPYLLPSSFVNFTFELNAKGVYLGYQAKGLARFTISSLGIMHQYTWNDRTRSWVYPRTLEYDKPFKCPVYNKCGAYGICPSLKILPMCLCLEGFQPKSPSQWNSSDWSSGCARKTSLNCYNDGFVKHSRMILPDTSNSSWFNSSLSLIDCEKMCSKNCSCTAYANLDIRGTGCLLWYGDLIDMKAFIEGGQDIYVRLAASDIDPGVPVNRRPSGKKVAGIITGSLVAAIVMLLLAGLCFAQRKSSWKSETAMKRTLKDEAVERYLEMLMLDPKTIAKATDYFSSDNKLGEGGFGPVYRGVLDGHEIAVKRLSKSSSQGLDELKAEVMFIAKLKHRNFVKLLGFCIDKDDKMLIYEYMSNNSLASFIFDKAKNKVLDWSKRFHIIEGVACGLLYLHQDSGLRIIHRDLKANNILLDNSFNVKISDFGLARTFEEDQTWANTKRVIGTCGYMSPEYALDGFFSTKSDVFSFGVLILEIVSGKKNQGFHHPDYDHDLLGHAWMLWTKGTPTELLDECILDKCNPYQVSRCIHAALLCVQQRPEDRPTMAQVVVMLETDNLFPEPKHPGFFMERNFSSPDGSLSCIATCSGGTMTETTFESR